jgi:hypothetical protein
MASDRPKLNRQNARLAWRGLLASSYLHHRQILTVMFARMQHRP